MPARCEHVKPESAAQPADILAADLDRPPVDRTRSCPNIFASDLRANTRDPAASVPSSELAAAVLQDACAAQAHMWREAARRGTSGPDDQALQHTSNVADCAGCVPDPVLPAEPSGALAPRPAGQVPAVGNIAACLRPIDTCTCTCMTTGVQEQPQFYTRCLHPATACMLNQRRGLLMPLSIVMYTQVLQPGHAMRTCSRHQHTSASSSSSDFSHAMVSS